MIPLQLRTPARAQPAPTRWPFRHRGLARSLPAMAIMGLAATGACQRQAAGDGAPHAIGVGAIPGTPGYENIVRGLELAVERLNAAGPTRFAVRLPPAGVSSPVRLAEQLREDPTVIAVVGHPESGNTLETVPIYADAEHEGANGVVMVSQTASSPRLSGVSPWFFRVAPSDADAAQHTAHWVLDTLGARRAAIIYRNDSYGRDWASTFADVFGKGGGIVATRDPYLTGVTEWEAYASLVALRKPDVVLFPGDADDAVQFLRSLRARGVRVPFVGGDGTEGIARDTIAVGAYVSAFFRADRASSPEAMHFLARYRDRFRQEPDGFAALSYDAAIVIGRTVAGGANTRPALRMALEGIGNGTPSVDGVVGRIAFDQNHDIKGRPVLLTRVTRAGAAGTGTGTDVPKTGAGAP
ncbi:putative branched-chain amino acid-binding protein [Gemmatimonas aurantiaca T-27]|nr:branched-chain amino acid ABC transporter substrate-binding protein [Gemmatimonas aurantiaca]BAH37545.1 putative branched-chain amino acid-binding protein [Gemmatimonas aurantiaca T-27]